MPGWRRLVWSLVIVGPTAVLLALGVDTLVKASSATPAEVEGTIESYSGGVGARAKWFLGDLHDLVISVPDGKPAQRRFGIRPEEFDPPLADLSSQHGLQVRVIYNQGTNDVMAIQDLTSADNALYAMEYYDYPRAGYWDKVAVGLVEAGLGLGWIGIFIFFLWVTRGPRVESAAANPAEDDLWLPFYSGTAVFVGWGLALLIQDDSPSLRVGSLEFWSAAVAGWAAIILAICLGIALTPKFAEGRRSIRLRSVSTAAMTIGLFGSAVGACVGVRILAEAFAHNF